MIRLVLVLGMSLVQAQNPFRPKRWSLAAIPQTPDAVFKRDGAVGPDGADQSEYIEMCERTSAMFAIRACRVFCMKNFQAYPDQCGVPGTAGTVIEMANQMRKMVTIEYCQDQYDQAIQKCLKMLS